MAWSSRRQLCIALSTMEAEYVAACEAIKEGVWLRCLFREIKPEWCRPLPLLRDNLPCIDLVKNQKIHQKTKHRDVRYHFIQTQQEANRIDVKYVPTAEQPADRLTKSLPNPQFSDLLNAIWVELTPGILTACICYY